MEDNLEPVYHLDYDFGKGWECYSFDHDKDVMVRRYEYQRQHPVPGRGVRLVDPKGRILFLVDRAEKVK